MTSLKFGNLVLEWDETLQVGDLVTGYHKGFHQIIRIQDRNNQPPLYTYKKRYGSDGKSIKSKIALECDSSWCRRASITLNKGILDREDEIKRYLDILKTC